MRSRSSSDGTRTSSPSLRYRVYCFLEGHSADGRIFEMITILLIIVSSLGYILSTVEEIRRVYENYFWAVESAVALVFTVEYLFRVWSIVEHRGASADSPYRGWIGRFKWMCSYYAIVDLLSFLPFYVELYFRFYNDTPIPVVRLLRLERMLRIEGRFVLAFDLLNRIFRSKGPLFLSASFVGVSVWFICSSLYYVTERRNPEMIYCPTGPDSCHNRFESIPSSMYFCLLNLFGEFPLIREHSPKGKVVATFVAIFAVAVFAIPTGIIGGAFQDIIDERKKEESLKEMVEEENSVAPCPDPRDRNSRSARLQRAISSSYAMPRIGFILVVSTVFSFYLSTCVVFEENATFVNVSNAIEIACLVFFGAEYVLRVYAAGCDPRYVGWWGRLKFATTGYATIDLLAVLPSLYAIYATSSIYATAPLRGLRLLRLFKAERLMNSFFIFWQVLRDNGQIFTVLLFIMMLVWTLCSTLMYLTESVNPDPHIAQYYQSIPGAMWVTLLNLTGESPICDFTVAGKIVTAFMGIFGVGVFAVPIGLFGAAWEDAVDSVDSDDDEEEEVGVKVGGRKGNVATPKETDALLGGGEGRGSADKDKRKLAAYSTCDLPPPAPSTRDSDSVRSSSSSSRASGSSSRNGGEGSTTTRPRKRASSHGAAISWKFFVNGRTTRGGYFVNAVYAFIFLTCVTAVLSTVNSINDKFGVLFDAIELVAVVFFTVEIFLRIYVAPERSEYRCVGGASRTESRFRYAASYFAIIDFVAVAPYYLAIAIPWFDRYDEQLRMLRIVRLLKVESAVPSLELLLSAIRSKREGLFIAVLDTIILWSIFSTLLYVSEVNDFVHAPDPEDPTQGFRYRNVPNALEYTMIHLTGDFPLIDYTLWGRVTCFFIVFAAVGVTSVPQGLIASGFTEFLVERRKKERHSKMRASVTIQRVIRGYIQRRHFRHYARTIRALRLLTTAMKIRSIRALEMALEAVDDVSVFMLATEMRVRFLDEVESAKHMLAVLRDARARHRDSLEDLRTWEEMHAQTMVSTSSPRRRKFPSEWAAFLRRMYAVLNSRRTKIAVMGLIVLNVASVLLESVPSIKRAAGQSSFDMFENASVVVFTVEYVLRLLSSKVGARYMYSRWTFATSFYGVVDLLSILPWYVMMFLRLFHVTFDAAVFRVFRVFRVLEFEKFIAAFTLLDDVYYKSKDVLKATGILALIIWIGGSTMFYAFQPDLFDNIPNAMYYTAVFLGGEWGMIDYNIPNKVLTVVFCVIAIALFSIPVATLFEAFADTLADVADGIDLNVLVKEGKMRIRATREFSIGGLAGTNTIREVKERIETMTSVNADDQIIIFRGKEIRDTEILGRVDYLEDGSTIRLEIPSDAYKRMFRKVGHMLHTHEEATIDGGR